QLRAADRTFKAEAEAELAAAADPAQRPAAQVRVSATARLAKIREIAAEIERQESAQQVERAAATASAFKVAVGALAIGFGAALALGVLCVVALSRAVSRPIQAMTAVMGRLAGGDNDVQVPAIERGDEVGRMARSVLAFKEAALARI